MTKVSTENITAVKKATGEGTTSCKNALIEANGNVSKAISLLKEKHRKAKNTYRKPIRKAEYEQLNTWCDYDGPTRNNTLGVNHFYCSSCAIEFYLNNHGNHSLWEIEYQRPVYCVFCGSNEKTMDYWGSPAHQQFIAWRRVEDAKFQQQIEKENSQDWLWRLIKILFLLGVLAWAVFS